MNDQLTCQARVPGNKYPCGRKGKGEWEGELLCGMHLSGRQRTAIADARYRKVRERNQLDAEIRQIAFTFDWVAAGRPDVADKIAHYHVIAQEARELG